MAKRESKKPSGRCYPKEPCKECPYIGNTPGWLGSYDDPQAFIDLIQQEQELPCHSAVDYTDPQWKANQWYAPRCSGQLMMANRMAKRFRDPEVSAKQDELEKAPMTPVELCELHRLSLRKLKRRKR